MRRNAFEMRLLPWPAVLDTQGRDARKCVQNAQKMQPNATRKKKYMPAVIPGRACRGASPAAAPHAA